MIDWRYLFKVSQPLAVMSGLTYLLPFLSETTRAATNSLHLRRSWASVCKVPHECPMAVASASTVRLHVILGRPRFLCPSGFHSNATLGMEPWSLRNIWPIHLQRLRAIVVSILACWHSSKRSWFEIIWGPKILTILRRFLVWKGW